MAVTLLAGQSQFVRCAICAKPVRRGDSLCAQCRAAVRRARHVPDVRSEYLPHPGQLASSPRTPARRDSRTRAAHAPRMGVSPVLGGWGTYATLIAFGLAVCLTGYLAMGDYEGVLGNRESSTANGAPAKVNAYAASEQRPRPSLAVDAEPPAESSGAAEDFQVPLESTAPVRESTDRRAGRDRRAAVRMPGRAVDPGTAGTETPPVAHESVAAGVATGAMAAPESAVNDRWQLFASALSRCERENIIAGLVCKERARLQYCEGEWGNAPQCPAGVASNNTR